MTKFEPKSDLGNFIIPLSKDKFKIDVLKYLDYTIPIIDRYRFPEEAPYEMIDRFIPQIMEEVYEFSLERQDIRNNDRVTSEFADIILYFVSILTEIHHNFEFSIDKDFRNVAIKTAADKEVSLMEVNNRYHSFYKGLKSQVQEKVIELIGYVRRLYPRRKYHVHTYDPAYMDDPKMTITALTNTAVAITEGIKDLLALYILQLRMENGVKYTDSIDALNKCIMIKMQRNLNRLKDFSFDE